MQPRLRTWVSWISEADPVERSPDGHQSDGRKSEIVTVTGGHCVKMDISPSPLLAGGPATTGP